MADKELRTTSIGGGGGGSGGAGGVGDRGRLLLGGGGGGRSHIGCGVCCFWVAYLTLCGTPNGEPVVLAECVLGAGRGHSQGERSLMSGRGKRLGGP